MFEKELDFFKTNQDELVSKYSGKTLVLQGEKILGIYNTIMEAYTESLKSLEPGSFMLQPCEPGIEAYTVTISNSELIAK